MAGAKTARFLYFASRKAETDTSAKKEIERAMNLTHKSMLVIAAFLSCAAAYALEVSSDEAREAVAGWASLGDALTARCFPCQRRCGSMKGERLYFKRAVDEAPLWLECRYRQHIYGVYLPIAVVLVVVERGAKRFQMLHEKFVCDSGPVIFDFVHNNSINCEALCHNCGAASMRNVVNSDFPLQYILAFHCSKFWRANASNSQSSNYREIA